MNKSFIERKKRVWIELNTNVANLDLAVSKDRGYFCVDTDKTSR